MDGHSVSIPVVEPGSGPSNGLFEEMKSIRKAKLNRQVFEDPSLARKLVATKASPVYNASAELITAVSGSLGAV